MTIHLRGHHLLCLLTYQGKGYTRAFTTNYTRLTRRLMAGETVQLVAGEDAICQPLLCDKAAHCHLAQSARNDAFALHDLSQLLGRPLDVGQTFCFTESLVRTLRAAFSQQHIRSACQHCRWHDQCTAIAEMGFVGTRLYPPPSPEVDATVELASGEGGCQD